MARQREAGWWYPWIFVAGMLVVIAVNGVLVYFALGSWTGISTDDAYRKGLAYNQALAAARAQDQRGWSATVAFERKEGDGAGHAGRLVVAFTDRDGDPLEDLRVTAALLRPTHEGYDQHIALTQQGSGVYAEDVVLPLPGQWDARIEAHRRDDAFVTRHRLDVR